MIPNSRENADVKRTGSIREIIIILAQALVLALALRIFLFQPFSIPSSSMESTLLIGDYLFVSKYSYGYSRYSFPFAAIPFTGRILASEPKRGDVVVFRKPTNDNEDYVKRLIGLPGDQIQVINGILTINGQAVHRVAVDNYQVVTKSGLSFNATRYRETLPNGVIHDILEKSDYEPYDNTPLYIVPAGHYFFMGDNRDGSLDSRVRDVGFVPFDNLIGRAEIKFFSIAPSQSGGLWQFLDWPYRIRWDRIFSWIK